MGGILITAWVLGDKKCNARILSNGLPDRSSWYRLWQAIEAMHTVCSLRRRVGSWKGFGMFFGRYGVVERCCADDVVWCRCEWKYFDYVDE